MGEGVYLLLFANQLNVSLAPGVSLLPETRYWFFHCSYFLKRNNVTAILGQVIHPILQLVKLPASVIERHL